MVWLFSLLLASKGFDLQEIGIIVATYPAVWGFGQLYSGSLADKYCFSQLFQIIGLKALSNDARIAWLDILEDRYGYGSTMITSQLPVDSWYNFIDEPAIADAIMDRLAASAHRISLACKSLRKKKNH